MKFIIFGGDGFLGWPLSLRLKNQGHDVVIVDDFSRREYDAELELRSLVPISSPELRSEISGINFHNIKVDQEYNKILSLFESFNPDAIVHFAQQRSAPVSMFNNKTKVSTVARNTSSTLNILEAVKSYNKDIHVLHMGSMGVYGYNSLVPIEEGYDIDGKLLSVRPGSIYHLTKCYDQLTFEMYNRLYSLKITDLHQGVVWGSQTDETLGSPELFNRYDYDSFYGTVVNRFMAQCVAFEPLTVYGSGKHSRAFINLSDSVDCCISALTAPKIYTDKVRIINQFTEILSINEVMHKIKHAGDKVYLKLRNPSYEDQFAVKVSNITDPRMDIVSPYSAINNSVHRLLKTPPILLSDDIILDNCNFIGNYIKYYNKNQVIPKSFWA